MRKLITLLFAICIYTIPLNLHAEGYLRADGTKIVDENGENYLLRGIGTGNWMLMEGYMMNTGGVAGTQHEWRAKLEALVGEEKTNEFFETWLANHFTKTDVDSMKAWGFNSIRVAMHYLWFTPPIEEETVAGEITWLNKGFEMIDSLLDWCGNNEMYLILDMHGTPGGQGTNADISDYDPSKPSLWESVENQDKLTALWFKLAERYQNEPWIGGYDLINETNWDFENNPNDDSGWSNTKNIPLLNMHKRLIDTIRTIDNNHLVFVSGNSWGNNYNGMDELGSYDENLAYTFHKYWTTNTPGDVDWIIEKSERLNVPLWMSESGENSNTWFTDAISLFESNNIGWSWWPVKKGGINNILRVDFNKEYDDLVKYWKGEIKTAPTADEAFNAVMQLAENHKIENCHIQYDVIDAMINQPHTTETKPFSTHTVGDTIFLTDYHYGQNGYAYFDQDVADYHSSGQDFTAWNAGYGYRNDGVDIETCTDEVTNGYSVGWTATGEWMIYTLEVDSTASYDLDIRYAANGGSGKFHLEINDVPVTQSTSLTSTGDWANWDTHTLEGVVLNEGRHILKLHVDNAGFNINYLKFYNPQPLANAEPQILNIKTNDAGTQIILQSNLGFDMTSLPKIEDFLFRISSDEQTIESLEFDSINPYQFILNFGVELIQTDKVYLSYDGTGLVSPEGQTYPEFENIRVENNSPFFFVLPMKIQAENYLINEGFQLEDCSDSGGGQNLSYASPGDYADYEISLAEANDFVFSYRAASGNSGRFKLQLVKDDEITDLHTVSVSTGGWQNWKTYTEKASLPAGKYILRLYAVSGEFNLNWIDVDFDTSTDFISNLDSNYLIIPSEEGISVLNHQLLEGTCTLTLYNLQSQKILHRKLDLGNQSRIDIQTETPIEGVYIGTVESIHGTTIQKIFIR